jgi:hypothetical protein
VFNFYHPFLDMELINFIANRLRINLLESKVKTKGIIEKLYCVRVIFLNFFYKKVNNLNLEGINSFKIYYNINILFSGNTLKKKTNDVFNNLFNKKLRDNHLSIVYKQKKQNMYEIYKEYYKYFSEMLREHAPQLNNPTFIQKLIKRNYWNNDFSNTNVLIGKMQVDLFLSVEKLHQNLSEKEKKYLAYAYKIAYEEHPGIFYLNEIQNKVVIMHTNITKNAFQKHFNDIFGIKNKIEPIVGNIRFPFGIIDDWHISVFLKKDFEYILKFGVIYPFFDSEGNYIAPEQMHFIDLFLNKMVKTGDFYIIDNFLFQPNGERKLHKILVNAKTNEKIFSIMVITNENKYCLRNLFINNKQIKSTILPEELFKDLNKYQPNIIEKLENKD